VNTPATLTPGVRLRPTAIFDFETGAPITRNGLQYVRASGLAQARLQLAILAGDRRRALREIDRLVEIDRQIAHIVNRGEPDGRSISHEGMEAHLARQQAAIASEKLALAAAVEFPRVPSLPDRSELLLEEECEPVVEDPALGRKLAFAGFWLVGVILLGTALAIAVPTLAAAF
jgi:hypothetical protein